MTDDTGQKRVIQLYGALAAAVVLQCLPVPVLQIVGAVLMLGALMRVYAMRRSAAPESLAHSHMVFLVRTVWISALFLLIGFLGASVWFYQMADHSLVYSMVDSVRAGVIPDETQIMGMLGSYKETNLRLLILASVFAAAPAVLYFTFRMAKGLSRAARGYRIASPKEWF